MQRDISTSTARDILRQARRQQFLSQAQLAARAGVTKTVVARYESGQQPTVAALERLVAACGYELTWSLRSIGGSRVATGVRTDAATDGAATGGAAAEATAGDIPFPGPIGRRLSAHLGEILGVLEAAGATDPRLYGDVADGCEGVRSCVLIGVSVDPKTNPVPVIAASGHISLIVDADVRVVPHSSVVDHGWGGTGVALTGEALPGEESLPIRRCG